MLDTNPTSPWWQRNLAWLILAGLLCLLVDLAAVGGAVFFMFNSSSMSATNTDVYQEALYRARTHPDVIGMLGGPVEAGGSLQGTVQVEGLSGQAEFVLPLAGSRREGLLYVVAAKEGSQWEFKVLEVAVEEQSVPINLLSSIRPTAAPTSLPPSPTPVPTRLLPTPPPMPTFEPQPELALKQFNSQPLGLSMPYPASWQVQEIEEWVIFYPASQSAYPTYPADTAIWVGRPDWDSKSEEGLLKDMLAQVTREVDITGHTTLIVPGHFWSVTHAKFDHQSLGPAQASLTLPMSRDDYVIFAIAPVAEWRKIQPAVEQIQFELQYSD